MYSLHTVYTCSPAQRVHSQLDQVRKEKEQAEMEKLNLSAVVATLQSDIRSLQDKRGLDQDELQRMTGGCRTSTVGWHAYCWREMRGHGANVIHV